MSDKYEELALQFVRSHGGYDDNRWLVSTLVRFAKWLDSQREECT